MFSFVGQCLQDPFGLLAFVSRSAVWNINHWYEYLTTAKTVSCHLSRGGKLSNTVAGLPLTIMEGRFSSGTIGWWPAPPNSKVRKEEL